ncbi:MAG: hypothetical protein ACXWK4_12420 [Myxococcaceae bacterium]
MKIARIGSMLFTAAGLVACSNSPGATQEFRAVAPTLEKLAISQNDGDPAEAVASASSTSAETAVPVHDCHPHLFVRTHEIIGRVNRHFFKHLHHVEELIEDHPLANGETRTWENVRGGIDRKFTVTRTANLDGSVTFDFELDVAPAPASATATFVKVMWGSVTHFGPLPTDGDGGTDQDGGSEQRVEDKGTVTFDFTALASVTPHERASGRITDTFDNVRDPVNGVKRSASITLTNFVPEEGDQHGARNGTYLWEREPGVGGKFQFQDTVVLFCLPNPEAAQSDLTTVSRWYKADDGQVRGRSDSKATAGQLPSGDTWMGVTCAKGQTTSAPAEGFWMMKLEDSTGKTVPGAYRAAQVGTEPCDPALGKTIPNAADSSTDYDFTAAVTFPGEW